MGLVAHLGSAVGADELVDLGWDDPPADPAGAVHSDIARLLPTGLRIETPPRATGCSPTGRRWTVTAFGSAASVLGSYSVNARQYSATMSVTLMAALTGPCRRDVVVSAAGSTRSRPSANSCRAAVL